MRSNGNPLDLASFLPTIAAKLLYADDEYTVWDTREEVYPAIITLNASSVRGFKGCNILICCRL